jgi:hypothetical protein
VYGAQREYVEHINFFFSPVACCFLYKAKDLSAPSYINFSYIRFASYELDMVQLVSMCILVGYEVLAAVVMKGFMLWALTPCSPLKVNRDFGGTYRYLTTCFHVVSFSGYSTVKMKAINNELALIL